MKSVKIYTDGACSGNPGPGGWGCVLLYGEHRLELSGYEEATTNNRMEITAAIQALSALKAPCRVTLYTDSSYLANAVEKGWLKRWRDHNWQRKSGEIQQPVKNPDLWQTLDRLLNMHQVRFVLVRGHQDNIENNRCDALATGEIRKNRVH